MGRGNLVSELVKKHAGAALISSPFVLLPRQSYYKLKIWLILLINPAKLLAFEINVPKLIKFYLIACLNCTPVGALGVSFLYAGERIDPRGLGTQLV